jgi:hypothetical protein
VESELVALATTAANTLVEQWTTDGWKRVAEAVGALWRTVYPERGDTIEAEATDTRDAVVRAREAGDEETERELVGEWRSKLRRLLIAEPRVADDLRQMLAEWQPDESVVGDARIGRMTMRVTASGNSRVSMAGRDIHIAGS